MRAIARRSRWRCAPTWPVRSSTTTPSARPAPNSRGSTAAGRPTAAPNGRSVVSPLDSRWFTTFTAPQATRRLICLPHAGGGSAAFARWRGALPADIELSALRLPGRETRLSERPLTHL
ncbi:MAG: hypothetical protein KC620_17365, partial [Myxococcales bacterium]|nr:hypothetical protein [Myxococcales bacterium]